MPRDFDFPIHSIPFYKLRLADLEWVHCAQYSMSKQAYIGTNTLEINENARVSYAKRHFVVVSGNFRLRGSVAW